jgi:NAD(P)-dependent dehydrogenase (short-subunit alcohol dehydrogenase family)
MMDGRTPEVVVVTGASAGVGRAVARKFGRHGARVALLARDREGLEGARREIEAAGGEGLPIPTDVSDPDQVEAAAERVEQELGPIDVWVNDAIAVVFAPFKDIEPEDFKRSTEVCYLGAVYGTKAALKHMLPRDRGTIVQVGSALSYRAIPLQSAYCGAKHGMRGFTDSVRTELMHDKSNVHITMVHLPAVNTPQFNVSKTTLSHHPQPVPPIYQPEVPAQAIYWAAHHKRREVWVGASSVIVITGNKLLPGLGDWYLARTGYSSQQTNEPVNQDRPNNLYEPVPGDHGAHGNLDAQSHGRSPQLWATENRAALLALAGAGLAGAAYAALRR